MKELVKLIKGKISYLLRGVTFFHFTQNNLSVDTDLSFKQVYTLKDFSDLKLNFEYPGTIIEDRFIQGNIFCFLEDNNSIASYGWINNSKAHYVGEINLMMKVKNNHEVLFDFYTFPQHRNKGYYRTLLNCICIRNNNVKIIYALKNNIRSIKAINKAGFKFLFNVYGYNKNRYINLPE